MRVSNSLDPDQARPSVGPDLGPNCLQSSSADDTRWQTVNIGLWLIYNFYHKKIMLNTIPTK